MQAMHAAAVDASNRYLSPRNPERKIRRTTELIVLHTTEAPARSSLNKLSERGECHFCVTEEGQIYRIVDRDREAFHAGRSMWNGKEDVDKFSVGIECVGYHDKAMPSVQLSALRELVKSLQAMYKIPDDRVVCHSHVAYGSPNKWQKKKHRGRKRCGMLFAMPSVRSRLGLASRPYFDRDVAARRLVVGDPYLRKVLYGRVDTMAAAMAKGQPPSPRPQAVISAKPAASKASAPPKTQPKAALPPPSPVASQPPRAQPVQAPKSVAELKKRGYVMKGSVSRENTASKIAGSKWNASDTYYTIRNKVISGKDIDPSRIEKGMSVWLPAK